MAYNKKTWLKNNKEKIKNRKCKICEIKLEFGKGKFKNYCKKCYNQIYYFKNWEKLIEKSKKLGTLKKDYSYYRGYFKRNPDKKRLLHIRQQTFHKYEKARVCSICKATNNIEHHHFIPYDVDNFIDLCINCHRKTYHRKSKKIKEK